MDRKHRMWVFLGFFFKRGKSSRVILEKVSAIKLRNFAEVRTSSMRIFRTSGSRSARISSGFCSWLSPSFFLFFFLVCFRKFPLRGCYNRSRCILPLLGRRFEANTQAGADADARERERERERRRGWRAGESLPPVVMQEAGSRN